MGTVTKTCTECGNAATRLRKQRCNACYMRQYRNDEVPDGDRCAGCGEAEFDFLARSRLGNEPTTLCGNCLLVVRRTRPLIQGVDTLRTRLPRPRPPMQPTWSATLTSPSSSAPTFDPAMD